VHGMSPIYLVVAVLVWVSKSKYNTDQIGVGRIQECKSLETGVY